LIGRIERGELHLTTLVQMRNHLTVETANELLDLARGRTRFQVEELRASVTPRPGAPSRMRKLPTPRTAQSIAPIERPVEPLAPERYRVQFNADRETHDGIVQARDLMRHSNPSGDLDPVFKYCVRSGVERLEARQQGLIRQRARRPAERRRAAKSRHVPRAIRRAVFERDGARCTFHDETGNRCPARTLLQLDHVDLYSHGGHHSLATLRVRCRAHNCWYAEQVLGKAFIEKRIRARQQGKCPSSPMSKAKSKGTADATRTAKDGANGIKKPLGDGVRTVHVKQKPAAAKPLKKTKEPRVRGARGPSGRLHSSRA
jgi:5-methylcytosine-specific restriction endonuclease McrA